MPLGGAFTSRHVRRGTAFAVATFTATLMSLLLSGPAGAARNMEVAVQDDPVFVGGVPVAGFPGRTVGLGYARELGATRIRVNVGWASALIPEHRNLRRAPRQPKYDWSRFDALVFEASLWGIKPQFNLNGPAPRWATGNRKEGPYKPKARYYRHFVKSAAKHFKGNVDRYSIWNEPNHVGWLAPVNSAPRIYRSLYKTAYKEIKRQDRRAWVLIGETSPYEIKGRRKTNALSPVDFLRKMTCSNSRLTRSKCRGLKADGYAHHPYDFNHRPSYRYPGRDNATMKTLNNLVRALDRLHRTKALRSRSGRKLNLFLTEYGYFASGERKVPESRRRKYLVQGFRMAQNHPRVKQMLQYLIFEPGRQYLFFDTSIAGPNGAKSPTFRSLAAWAKRAARSRDIKRQPAMNPALLGGREAAPPPQQTTTSPPHPTQPPASQNGASGGGTAPSPPPENPGSQPAPAPPPEDEPGICSIPLLELFCP